MLTFAASLAFTYGVRALRTRQHRARCAMRRCSSLRAVARSVFAPCLARRSRHWQARSTAESRLNLERLEPRMAFAAGPCT